MSTRETSWLWKELDVKMHINSPPRFRIMSFELRKMMSYIELSFESVQADTTSVNVVSLKTVVSV